MPEIYYQNRLLNALCGISQHSIFSDLKSIHVEEDDVLSFSFQTSPWIYFPDSAKLSIQIENERGSPQEILAIGRIGASVLLPVSLDTAPKHRCVVIQSGTVWQVEANQLIELAHSSSQVLRTILQYNETMTNLIAQTTFCNAHHNSLQRLCRFLLLLSDPTEEERGALPLKALQTSSSVVLTDLQSNIRTLEAKNAVALHKETLSILSLVEIENANCGCSTVMNKAVETFFSFIPKI